MRSAHVELSVSLPESCKEMVSWNTTLGSVTTLKHHISNGIFITIEKRMEGMNARMTGAPTGCGRYWGRELWIGRCKYGHEPNARKKNEKT